MAYGFGGIGQRNESSEAPVLMVADADQSISSAHLIQELKKLKEFNVKTSSVDSAENEIRKGNLPAMLVIHHGFDDSLHAGKKPPVGFEFDEAKFAEVGILKSVLIGQLTRMIGTNYQIKQLLASFDAHNPNMDSPSRKMVHEQIVRNFSFVENNQSTESFITSIPLIAKKKNSPGLIQAVAGVAIMMLLFSVVGMGASLLEEKQEGTLKKLLIAPIHPNSILFGKMMYANLVSILQLVVMFLYANLCFGLDIFHHPVSLVLMILSTAFACSAFGMLIASFAKSQQQVRGMSTLIVIIMSCLGGSMIPIYFMPPIMQKIAVYTVNYWSIQGFFDIFWRNRPLWDVTFLTRILVLLIIGAVLDFIALQLFRKNIFNLA